jgi:nicotinamide-nucleotide amidase
VRIEIVAVGTELLLGQIADTNSAWLGEHLAANGVTSHFHQAVGDNHDRIVLACAPRWPAATASSCAAGSGRPRTTSPGRPSPRS